jgi:hypothetical protein
MIRLRRILKDYEEYRALAQRCRNGLGVSLLYRGATEQARCRN